jgi:hypothetical protein
LTGLLAALIGQFGTDDFLRVLALGRICMARPRIAGAGHGRVGMLAGEVAMTVPYARGEAGEGLRRVAEEVITQSAEETIAWGREFSKRLRAPVLVLLSGELGSGKLL